MPSSPPPYFLLFLPLFEQLCESSLLCLYVCTAVLKLIEIPYFFWNRAFICSQAGLNSQMCAFLVLSRAALCNAQPWLSSLLSLTCLSPQRLHEASAVDSWLNAVWLQNSQWSHCVSFLSAGWQVWATVPGSKCLLSEVILTSGKSQLLPVPEPERKVEEDTHWVACSSIHHNCDHIL